MEHLAPSLVSRIIFRCLSFNCYNISICKKEKLKVETSKKFRETNGSQQDMHRFHEFSLDISSLIVATSCISICKKGKVKDETSKKICEINGGQIKEQDIPLT